MGDKGVWNLLTCNAKDFDSTLRVKCMSIFPVPLDLQTLCHRSAGEDRTVRQIRCPPYPHVSIRMPTLPTLKQSASASAPASARLKAPDANASSRVCGRVVAESGDGVWLIVRFS